MNVDWVVLLLGGGGDTSILNAVIKVVSNFSNPGWWESKNLAQNEGHEKWKSCEECEGCKGCGGARGARGMRGARGARSARSVRGTRGAGVREV